MTLLLAHLVLGVVALLVVGFVAYPYRGREIPRAERLTDSLAAAVERVDPGEAPPLGVLTHPGEVPRDVGPLRAGRAAGTPGGHRRPRLT